MVKASGDERFLTEVRFSPGKTKATAVLPYCSYGQYSDSSGNKYPFLI